MNSIDSRLRRPECGHAPDERRPPIAVYPDEPDKGFEGDPNEKCTRCGRPLWPIIRVVYEGEEGEGP